MSVWDEKPEFPLDFTTKYEHYKGLIRYWQQKNDAWLEKVKAHYDRLEGIVGALEEMGVLAVYDMEHWSTDYAKLKEKAQKWDKLESDYKITRDIALTTNEKLLRIIKEKDEKLEAVKNLLGEYEEWAERDRRSMDMTPSFDPVKFYDKIKKALEAEG